MPRWPNGQGRLATNQEGAGSTPARGARRSVAQRQSIGPTNRGAQVRVLPDRRWSWCSGPAFLTVTQAAPVRLRVITPCQMWATAAQSPVKRPPRHPPSDSGIWLASHASGGGLLRWVSEARMPRSTRGGSAHVAHLTGVGGGLQNRGSGFDSRRRLSSPPQADGRMV